MKVVWMYHDIMDLYGDKGNMMVLKKRCLDRGIPFELDTCGIGEEKDLSEYDLIFLGGGADKEQISLIPDLLSRKENITKAIDEKTFVLLICGGYQLLGKYYTAPNGEKIQGLGILDIYTEAGDTRFIGDTVIYNEDFNETYVGFENHSGRTYVNGLKPLGKCVHGYGNNGSDGYEGCIYKNTYCTYFHGSLLAKNPELADRFIKTALEMKYSEVALERLDDSLEIKAKEVMINRLNKKHNS